MVLEEREDMTTNAFKQHLKLTEKMAAGHGL